MTRQQKRHELRVLAKQLKKMKKAGLLVKRPKPKVERFKDFMKRLIGGTPNESKP